MLKRIIITLWAIITGINAIPQEVSKTNISGTVRDTLYHPIEYVAIQLISKNDSLSYGAITSDDGSYSIDNVILGYYELRASSIGYTTVKKNIDLKSGRRKTQLGLIMLKENAYTLDEVEIEGTGVKDRIDRIIFIPDSITLRNTKTGIDVLNKIPEVRVDKKDQAISVLGNKNVLVLINGIDNGRSIASIHPDNIKKIEVITHPTVKYRSDIASVVNVLLKDYKQKGFALSSNLYYCLDKKNHTGNLQLDYNVGKWSFFLSYLGNYSNQKSIDSIIRTDLYKSNIETYKSYPLSNNSSDIALNRIQYGFDYSIDNKNIISFTSRFNGTNIESYRHFTVSNFSDDVLNTQSSIKSSFNSDRTDQNYSFYYLHKFNNEDENITINTNLYNLNKKSNQQINDSVISYPSKNLNKSSRTIDAEYKQQSLNTKVDYTKPLTENLFLENGYQFYQRKIKSKLEALDTNDNLSYIDKRNSFYVNTTYQRKKWNFQLGFRLENYNIKVDEIKNNQSKFLPYGAIFYKPNAKNSLKLIFRRSLDYPIFSYLNPFRYYSTDSLSCFTGNPYLKPELKNELSFVYSYNKKQTHMSLGINYNYLDGIIAQDILLQNNQLIYSYNNLGIARQYETTLAASSYLFNWLEFEMLFKGGFIDYLTKPTHSGYFYSVDYDIYFPFFWDMDMEISGVLKEREINYFGYSKYGGYIEEISLTKSVSENLSIGFAVWTPFTKVKDTEKTFGNNFTEINNNYDLQNPSYLLNITYYIKTGKKNKKLKKDLIMENPKSKGKSIK